MAPRIDPALPLVWRSPTELQLGGLTPRVVMRDPGGLETGLVAALRHGASVSTLRTIGAGLDGSPAEVDRVLELLAPAFDDATDVPRPASDRPAGRVVVDADGEVARLLLANLAALGHGAVGLDDADAGDEPAGADVALAVIAAPWVIPPARHLPWLRRDVPHLSVVDDERGVTIGPLVRSRTRSVPAVRRARPSRCRRRLAGDRGTARGTTRPAPRLPVGVRRGRGSGIRHRRPPATRPQRPRGRVAHPRGRRSPVAAAAPGAPRVRVSSSCRNRDGSRAPRYAPTWRAQLSSSRRRARVMPTYSSRRSSSIASNPLA